MEQKERLMKVLKFFIILAACYILMWIVWEGLEAVWAICLAFGGAFSLFLLICIFAVVPALVLAMIVFRW